MNILAFLAALLAVSLAIIRVGEGATEQARALNEPSAQLQRIVSATRDVLISNGADSVDPTAAFFTPAIRDQIAQRASVVVDERVSFLVLERRPVTPGSRCTLRSVVVVRTPTTGVPVGVSTGALADQYSLDVDVPSGLISLKTERISRCAQYEALARNVARAFEKRAKARALVAPTRDAQLLNWLDRFDDANIATPSLAATAVGGVIRLAPANNGANIAAALGLSDQEVEFTTNGMQISVNAVQPVVSGYFQLDLFVNPPWAIADGTPPRSLTTGSTMVSVIQPIQ